MADDFNNFYCGPSMFQHMSLILFLLKKCQRGRLLEIFFFHNLRKNCATCFSRLIEAIRGKNMSCLKVGA